MLWNGNKISYCCRIRGTKLSGIVSFIVRGGVQNFWELWVHAIINCGVLFSGNILFLQVGGGTKECLKCTNNLSKDIFWSPCLKITINKPLCLNKNSNFVNFSYF